MEKLVYVVWKDGAEPDAAFNERLLGPVRARLGDAGVQRLQINVVDATVAPGAHLRQQNVRPAPAGLVSFWLNSSHVRLPPESILQEATARIAGYAVTESTVLPIAEAATDGARTRGFSQLAFITQPPRLPYEGWREIWLRDQTPVAVETQSNFYYCQHIVNRILTPGAPVWHAIVEECFPIEALTDSQVFFDAVGQPEKFAANLKRMMDNVARFIDTDKIDVILTSQFRFGGWADLPR